MSARALLRKKIQNIQQSISVLCEKLNSTQKQAALELAGVRKGTVLAAPHSRLQRKKYYIVDDACVVNSKHSSGITVIAVCYACNSKGEFEPSAKSTRVFNERQLKLMTIVR